MLRAARVALGRNPPLRLRVVALPPGEDPADLVKRTGGDEIRGASTSPSPFIRFRRAARARDGRSQRAREGRDRVIDELGEVLLPMGPSAEREELRRIAADRLDMSPELLEQRAAAAAAATPSRVPAPARRGRRRRPRRRAAGPRARRRRDARPPRADRAVVSRRCASRCPRSGRPRSPSSTSRPTSRARSRAAPPSTCASTSTRRRRASPTTIRCSAFMRELAVGDARAGERDGGGVRDRAPAARRSRAWTARSRRRASRRAATSPSSRAAALGGAGAAVARRRAGDGRRALRARLSVDLTNRRVSS